MLRIFVLLFVVVSLVSTQAQPPNTANVPVQKDPRPKDSTPEKANIQKEKSAYIGKTLVLYPALFPLPRNKNSLTIARRDQIRDNAALHYYRALLMLAQEKKDGSKYSQELAELQELIKKPLDKQGQAKISSFLKRHERVLKEIRLAAQSDHCDWEFASGLSEEGFGFLLPEIQGLRGLNVLLELHGFLRISELKFDEALEDIKASLRMCRHCDEGGFLIGHLVSLALSQAYSNLLEAWMQQEKSANLYYSLSEIPAARSQIEKILDMEQRSIEGSLPFLKEVDRRVLTEKDLNKICDTLMRVQSETDSIESLKRTLAIGALSFQGPYAKKKLIESGYPKKQIEDLLPLQAVLWYEKLIFLDMYEEAIHCYRLPYDEGRKAYAAFERKLKSSIAQNKSSVGLILARIIPSMERVQMSDARFDRKIAALKIIEAIRYYASEHEGKFPEKLADLAPLYIPKDPAFDVPFDYELQGDQAILSTKPLNDLKPSDMNVVRYVLKMGAKK